MKKDYQEVLEELKSRVDLLTKKHLVIAAVYSQEDADTLREIWGDGAPGYTIVVQPPAAGWASLSEPQIAQIRSDYRRYKLPLPSDLEAVLCAPT